MEQEWPMSLPSCQVWQENGAQSSGRPMHHIVTLSPHSQRTQEVFNHSKHSREAAQKMLHVCQGNQSVSDYAIDFQTLATASGLNTKAQFYILFNGISEGIKDELVTLDQPVSLDTLVDLAILLEGYLQQCLK